MIELGLIAPVDHHIRDKAARRGDHLAFHDAEEAVSYAQLDNATLGLATALADLDVKPGQSVAVFLPNGVRWVVAALAIVRRGAVMVPISADSTDDEVTYRLQDAGCVAIIARTDKLDQLARCCRQASGIRHLIIDGLPEEADKAPVHSFERLVSIPPRLDSVVSANLDAPAFLLYTSGTTGRAKGVVLTQRGMMWVVASSLVPVAGLTENDHLLSPLPLFHSYALDVVVLGTLALGATARIMTRFSTDETLSLLASGDYTVLPGVPTMFHYLLDRIGDAPAKTGKLRLCISAGAIMPGPLNEAFEKRLCVPLIDGYGITETSTFVTMNAPGRPRLMGSCGIAIPGQAVRIVDAATRKDVAAGGEGELIVRGPNVMLRYHNKPEETAKALVDGWYLTGDLARADANGLITITGRLKEIIIRGGQNIAPAEIEDTVQLLPGVADCAVVAGKHPALGEVPVLFVVAREGATLTEAGIKDHCRQRLSAYKVPDSVRLTDTIPRTGSGKIQRFVLQKMLG
jgi:long-chain acyl-CoA synthetase